MRKTDLRYKTLLIPIAIIIVLGTGASTTEAFSKRKAERPNLTEEQRNTLSEAKKLLEKGDEEAAKLLLIEAGLGHVLNHGKFARKEDRELVRAAIEENDYEAFLLATKNGPFAEDITENIFERLVEAHTLSINGDKEGAREIRDELNLPKKPHHKNKHGEKRVKFTAEEQEMIKSFDGDRDKIKSYIKELKQNK